MSKALRVSLPLLIFAFAILVIFKDFIWADKVRRCDHPLAPVSYQNKIPIIVTAASYSTFSDLEKTVQSIQEVIPQHK